MYSFDFNNVRANHELTEMIRMFLPSSEFEIKKGGKFKIPDKVTDKDEGKRFIYDTLKKTEGKTLKWGILTGIRPVKFSGELFRKGYTESQVYEILTKEYYLSDEKARLVIDIRKRQDNLPINRDRKAIALYIGIPFCPSRCLYCSFTSYKASYDKIKLYLKALKKEIEQIGDFLKEKAYFPETIYIGGGTPTVLEENELEDLLLTIKDNFDLSSLVEYTLEAGRPDTINEVKLETIKKLGVNRISINPQTTKESTLEEIGRNHSNDQLYKAFEIGRKVSFLGINADLIAGLPREDTKDFAKSLTDIIKLKPENITVHGLAIKRASRLKKESPDYSYNFGRQWDEMMDVSKELLAEAGYKPYYLYRQKQMVGNLENVGYSLPGKESIYNVRIMEEDQTIIGLGAGGVSKIYYPEENRLERIPNVSNYEVYIDRVEEMIERKRNGIG